MARKLKIGKHKNRRNDPGRVKAARDEKRTKKMKTGRATKYAENCILRAMQQGETTARDLFVLTGLHDKDEFYDTLRAMRDENRIVWDADGMVRLVTER